jgi:hypothetical protein
MTVGLISFASVPAFPGQAGNPVGFSATPATAPARFSSLSGQSWPGAYSSLTAWPGGTGAKTLSDGTNATSGAGTAGNPWVFAFYDFDSLTAGVTLSLSNAIFVGCRFQSNSPNNFNVVSTGNNLGFLYCSFVPRTALYTAAPNAAWPSAGAGLQIVPASGSYTNTNGYCIIADNAYQYGLVPNSGGPVTADHCDFWGFGNGGPLFVSTTAQMTVADCWIHDAANCNVTPAGGSTNYHTDGTGYINGDTPTSNVSIIHCTIASIGNTNAIAFQAATSGYSNISVTRSYFSGFGSCVDMCHNTSGNTNLTFTDNYLATDLPWIFGPIYADFTTQFTGTTNVWRRNKLKVASGTSPIGGSGFSFTSADDGKFLFPNSALSTTDFTG